MSRIDSPRWQPAANQIHLEGWRASSPGHARRFLGRVVEALADSGATVVDGYLYDTAEAALLEYEATPTLAWNWAASEAIDAFRAKASNAIVDAHQAAREAAARKTG